MPRRAGARACISPVTVMLILALVGTLAASTPDTVMRVPGTRLRLGMSEAQVFEADASVEVKAPEASGTTSRQGDTRFFGVPCQATCSFRDGRLTRVRFQAVDASPHALDYVEDQLRRMRMGRECLRYAPGDHVCDWLGESVQVHLEIQGDRLDATVEPWPPPREPETSSHRAGAGEPGGTDAAAGHDAAPDSGLVDAGAVATLPETLMISLVSKNSPSDWPRVVSSPPVDYPQAAGRGSVEGVVWVLALVDPDGGVRSATVDRSIHELDDAAVAWVSRVRFAPCERQGQPCRFHVRVAVRFALP